MEEQKIVYYFYAWYNGHRYDVCVVNRDAKPCFNILEKNKLVSIPNFLTKPTISQKFSTKGWEKVLEITYNEEEKILDVKFKKSHYRLNVNVRYEEPANTRITIEALPKC